MPISPHSQLNQHQQPSIPPLIDLNSPLPSFVSMSSSSATMQSLHPTRPKSHSPPSRAPIRAPQRHPPPPRHHLDESDIDRFAMLFAPATPPATPTRTVDANEQSLSKRLSQSLPWTTQHRRTYTRVPQIPISVHSCRPTPSRPVDLSSGITVPAAESSSVVDARNVSLDYFGQFTTTAKVASERNRKEEEPELLGNAMSTSQGNAPGHAPILAPHESIADALASELDISPVLTLTRKQSLAGLPRTGSPLPPHLSGNASPPSASSPSASRVSLPLNLGLDKVQGSGDEERRVKEGEINRERQSSFLIRSITHRGSPFVSTPFVPPSGAPGFTGDRNWDRESGAVDITGLGGELDHEGISDLLSGSRKDEFGTGGRRLKSTRGTVSEGLSLCGRREGTLQVLTEDVANSLRIHLPALVRLSRNWTLLYSIDQHGISLNTLYTRSEPRTRSKAEPNPPSGALLVVKDSLDGCLVHGDRTGFMGVAKLSLAIRTDASPPLEYKWSGKNDYVVLCDLIHLVWRRRWPYGLYIDSSLLEGSSAPCPTFDNPVLYVSFECVGLEVWGIGPG
ncbi:hypothetical protein BKA82DRAFT_4185132 [Pisolithus tinctorius]|nr:hypothetical protein BKA82DRAFT_4185132 [Pisolithus tinctorius]